FRVGHGRWWRHLLRRLLNDLHTLALEEKRQHFPGRFVAETLDFEYPHLVPRDLVDRAQARDAVEPEVRGLPPFHELARFDDQFEWIRARRHRQEVDSSVWPESPLRDLSAASSTPLAAHEVAGAARPLRPAPGPPPQLPHR